MKLFALYLPQFHTIPENDAWWGEGFTEWVNVKKARPLFRGHRQPIAPADGVYYNLTDRQTVERQTQQMRDYGLDGMIYYHYYFCGRKLLEKPAENLLVWKDIEQPFFFCWANHSWNRAWKGSREVLLEQTYGTEEDWRAHFAYLLPFFQDERYEKRDNKPIFMIYDCSFPEKHDMLACFDRWCRESGFDGIYVIEECFSAQPDALRACREKCAKQTGKIYVTQPLAGRLLAYTSHCRLVEKLKRQIFKLRQKGILKSVETYDGNKIYRAMIQDIPRDGDLIPGAFFSWDNTPRHGTRGYIITPPEKALFMEYMDKVCESDYLIINSWNEWAEGMMIEPTAHNGDTYLSWIRQWVTENAHQEEA